MLYYLKQEVIGEHADAVLKGADSRYLSVPIQPKADTQAQLLELIDAFIHFI